MSTASERTEAYNYGYKDGYDAAVADHQTAVREAVEKALQQFEDFAKILASCHQFKEADEIRKRVAEANTEIDGFEYGKAKDEIVKKEVGIE